MDPISKDMPSTLELMNAPSLDRLRYPINKADCAPRAIAVVTLKPYEEVVCALYRNSTSRSRTKTQPRAYMADILQTITNFGFTVTTMYYPQVKTIRQVDEWLGPKGIFMIAVSGHVAGVRDGVVYDWASGRLHRIKGIYRITKTKMD